VRRTREVKAETRNAILKQASRLFRQRGVEGASVGDVMSEAGLTHGGFYRHFANKDALVAATIRATFEEITETMEEQAVAVGMKQAVENYLAFYLSDAHVANPGLGCPVPALAGEISRASMALRTEFGGSFIRSLETISKGLSGSEAARRTQATRELAMRVGAILIARASDPTTAKKVLEACREPGHPARSENENSI
jgi:TetR/AcrR family transcriptional repressor of nem operon